MFITDFELYLRAACKCGYNTTAKLMQFFKRIIIARNNGILVNDPFASYKIRLEKVDRALLDICRYGSFRVIPRYKLFPAAYFTVSVVCAFAAYTQ